MRFLAFDKIKPELEKDFEGIMLRLGFHENGAANKHHPPRRSCPESFLVTRKIKGGVQPAFSLET
jgi:hypothetical protein